MEGASQFGFVFETRTPEYVIVNMLGTRERYEILNVLEFTSARKRMSVVVRCPDGKIKLYCKGADTVIFERLGESHQQFRTVTLHHLENFATEGLRTLCLAVADISEEYYDVNAHALKFDSSGLFMVIIVLYTAGMEAYLLQSIDLTAEQRTKVVGCCESH